MFEKKIVGKKFIAISQKIKACCLLPFTVSEHVKGGMLNDFSDPISVSSDKNHPNNEISLKKNSSTNSVDKKSLTVRGY